MRYKIQFEIQTGHHFRKQSVSNIEETVFYTLNANNLQQDSDPTLQNSLGMRIRATNSISKQVL